MVNLDDLTLAEANSMWRRMWQRSSSMNDALMKAMKYPFRINSQKLVILFSDEDVSIRTQTNLHLAIRRMFLIYFSYPRMMED